MNEKSAVSAEQKFGRLTVLEPVTDRKTPYWLCRCDCGKTVIYSQAQLVNGCRKSCGCMKSPDITGQRYGLLTVVGRSDKRGPRGKRTVPLWECRCDCGAIVYKAKDTLTNPDECSCTDCANRNNAANMRKNAGFVEGTQLSRLTSTEPVGLNGSGRRGVSYDKKTNRWRARIGFHGQKINLGYYKTLDEAVSARICAEQLYFKPLLEKYAWVEQPK